MTLHVIQINIWMGKFLHKLTKFLKQEEPDVVTMQEVSGGAPNLWSDKTIDMFLHFRDALGMQGVVAPSYRAIGDPTSYFGNAVLVAGKVLDHRVVWLKEYREVESIKDPDVWPTLPRNVLDVECEFAAGRKLHVLSTHGAWGREPVDTPEKVRQAGVLAAHLRSLGDEPYILGGDFNMESGSEVIRTIDSVAHNAVVASAIMSTLNMRIHYAASKIPEGRRVDFIYTSPHFTVTRIETPMVDVSDHLPVRAELAFNSFMSS